MFKRKSKLFIFVAIFFIFLSSFSFATTVDPNAIEGIVPISAPIDSTLDEEPVKNIREGDVYVDDSNSDYSIKNAVNGNAFITAKNFTLNPKEDGGTIQGNLFVTAKTVVVQSDTVYSSTQKDEENSPKIDAINSVAAIGGNVYVVADKFKLEPGAEIGGDLYITANEIEISPYSNIYGSVYLVGNKVKLYGSVYGDFYGTCNSFEMQYFGCVTRDLHLNSSTASLNGIVYRNSFIDTKTLVTRKDFMSHGNFEVIDSNLSIILGEFKGNAKINSKELYIVTEANLVENETSVNKIDGLMDHIKYPNPNTGSNSFITVINGTLEYSAKKEITIEDGVILGGKPTYSKYSSMPKFKEDILPKLISLITCVIYTLVVYAIIKKFKPSLIESSTKTFTFKNVLISLGIGIGLGIGVPIIFVLLALSQVGVTVGLLIVLIYILMLALATPMLLITKAEFANAKMFGSKLNSYLAVMLIAVIYWLATLIPYAGPVLAILVSVIGTGRLFLLKGKEIKE